MTIEYCTLDIETLEKPMPAEMLAEADKKIQAKNAAAFKKPDVIAAHNAEDLEKFRSGWKFSRAGAQILCVGIGFFDADGGMVDLICCPHADEREMLDLTWQALDVAVNDFGFKSNILPPVYTFNGSGFDFPHLLRACGEHRLFPAQRFLLKGHTDLMLYPFEKHASGSVNLGAMFDFHCKAALPERFAVADFPDADGSQVAAMWAADQAEPFDLPTESRIYRYNAADLWMTGQIARAVRGLFV